MSPPREIARARTGSRAISRREATALLIYFAVAAGLLANMVAMLFDLADERAALEDSRDALARLERPVQSAPSNNAVGAESKARQLLTGATITIAGAALQARVEAAAKKAGAKILSSQIDLQSPRAAEGFIGLSDSLEIHQSDLQALLYDLESGMPFLFVDSLEVESPEAFGESEAARMRAKIGVSGQWRGKP